MARPTARHPRDPDPPPGWRLQVGPGTATPVTIVPANDASWDDLRAIFGDRGYAATCECQRWKMGHYPWSGDTVAQRMDRLREETHCGDPAARATSGLVAYLAGEPAGWCAVEPRSAFDFGNSPVPWKGRDEDPSDVDVWAITCFITRAGYRRRGISRALAFATVDFARARGARALEGYPMLVAPGDNVTWGELNVGSRSVFAEAGFSEVSHPTLRRVVMRIDFD